MPDCTVCPGVPRYSMNGETTTATRMTRATCWVLTSARRAPTRGARKGLEALPALFEPVADDGDEGEATFLLALLSALPASLATTETTCSVQRSDASLPARGATAAARGSDHASPAKAAAIVRVRSHETSDLEIFRFFKYFLLVRVFLDAFLSGAGHCKPRKTPTPLTPRPRKRPAAARFRAPSSPPRSCACRARRAPRPRPGTRGRPRGRRRWPPLWPWRRHANKGRGRRRRGRRGRRRGRRPGSIARAGSRRFWKNVFEFLSFFGFFVFVSGKKKRKRSTTEVEIQQTHPQRSFFTHRTILSRTGLGALEGGGCGFCAGTAAAVCRRRRP